MLLLSFHYYIARSGLVETVEGRISLLAVLCDVKSECLVFLINTKFCKDTDDTDADQGSDYRHCGRYENTDDLCHKKPGFAVSPNTRPSH